MRVTLCFLLGVALPVSERPLAPEVQHGRPACGFVVVGASPVEWFDHLAAAHAGAGFVVTERAAAARPTDPSTLVARLNVPGNPHVFAVAYRCVRTERGTDIDCCPEIREVGTPSARNAERRNASARAFEAARRSAFARLARWYRTSSTATRPRYTRAP